MLFFFQLKVPFFPHYVFAIWLVKRKRNFTVLLIFVDNTL